jgi:hypothetical protein
VASSYVEGAAVTAEQSNSPKATLALSTKLEEEFVSPLTAVRGALEILRDFPDLEPIQRQRFVESALLECARLEKGVEQLASTVYAAGQRNPEQASEPDLFAGSSGYQERIHFLTAGDTVEVDLSSMEFSSSKVVNEFYDVLDHAIEASGRSWYFAVNYRDCSIWPEAWVAFAHRSKKVNVSYSLGSVRYVEHDEADGEAVNGASASAESSDTFSSREQALAHIAALREAAQAPALRGVRGRH